MSRELTAIAQRLFRTGLSSIGMQTLQHISAEKKFGPDKADELKWITSSNIRTVLDIGAHAGESSLQMRSILPDATIYAFEPLSKPYAKLVNAMAADNNFSAFQCAIGERNGRAQMQENDFTQSSSILPMANRHRLEFPFTANTEPEEVQISRLDDVALRLSLKDNILIKIDVQGYEDRVIRGGPETIRKAAIVIIEVSFFELYEGQPLFPTIYDQLRSLGFWYGGQLHQLKSPTNGQPLQADAIFIRN